METKEKRDKVFRDMEKVKQYQYEKIKLPVDMPKFTKLEPSNTTLEKKDLNPALVKRREFSFRY